VPAFLAARPETVEFLIEARPHIEKQFGKEVVVDVRFPRNAADEILSLLGD
jgi:hypothetical protein